MSAACAEHGVSDQLRRRIPSTTCQVRERDRACLGPLRRQAVRGGRPRREVVISEIIPREDGGTGRRARLRIWFRKEWRFKSSSSHSSGSARLSRMRSALNIRRWRAAWSSSGPLGLGDGDARICGTSCIVVGHGRPKIGFGRCTTDHPECLHRRGLRSGRLAFAGTCLEACRPRGGSKEAPHRRVADVQGGRTGANLAHCSRVQGDHSRGAQNPRPWLQIGTRAGTIRRTDPSYHAERSSWTVRHSSDLRVERRGVGQRGSSPTRS